MPQPARTVEVVPYDPSWPTKFEEEALRIRQALGDNCIRIHHIGSTSVPGLDAKPIIDMIPVVQNILLLDTPEIIKAMEGIGYVGKGENGIPFRRFFTKALAVNVHVFEESSPEIEHHISFRNYLCNNPNSREEYAELKRQLAAKYPNDIDKYCLGKADFINAIGKATGFEGFFIRNCFTGAEWEAFHNILGIEQGISEYSKENTDLHLEDDTQNFYFVLCKGSTLTAAGHVRLLRPDSAEIVASAVAKKFQQEIIHETEFLKLLEVWIKHRGFKFIKK